ncbi:cytosolic 5'-nucleotidase 1A [Xiphias gladius]|uniref:cytosolic 5'-nucleotidase 1A n=1 Tax=Xiphias gladius TaxID=8245 RepID=UPI001A99CC7C|nr:cytosolic 5'-nucleotidase 1A [Xiphias gladius]
MLPAVRNSDAKQKDADRAVVVAVTSRAVFESGGADDDEDQDQVYEVGTAFPLLQALQRVNHRLLEENPVESLLFDVVLITTDRRRQRQSSRITASTRHYGLEVGRFCFAAEEDFIESLLKNNVRLFLSTDRNEAAQASQQGVFSALLDQQTASFPSEQLRILFCGDAIIRPDTGPTPASRQAAQSFSAQLGEMRRSFSVLDSPLSIVLVTSRGGRESCGEALRALRSRGVSVDEAYCLAGSPRGRMLSLLRPHFMLSDGFGDLEG